MKKPTAAQIAVLEKMAQGERAEQWLHSTTGLRGNGTFAKIYFATLRALHQNAWVERQEETEGKAACRHYVITSAGRSALERANV